MSMNIVPFPAYRREPWKHEPDHVSSKTKDGYHLVINRHFHFLTLNGYVGINKRHPYYGLSPWGNDLDLEVHGGITFGDSGAGAVVPGFDESLWYFGFDCGHYMDYNPGLERDLRAAGIPRVAPELANASFDGRSFSALLEQMVQYRDIHYVSAEVQSLYRQLRRIANKAKYNKRMARRIQKKL